MPTQSLAVTLLAMLLVLMVKVDELVLVVVATDETSAGFVCKSSPYSRAILVAVTELAEYRLDCREEICRPAAAKRPNAKITSATNTSIKVKPCWAVRLKESV